MALYIEVTIIICSMAVVLAYVRWLQRMNQENRRIQANITQTTGFLNRIQEQENAVRKYRHDLQKHIRLVEEILREEKQYAHFEEYQMLEGYIQKMEEDISSQPRKTYCDYAILNAVCELKEKECREKEIPFFVEISYQDLSWIGNIHLAGILLNLLDNAIEAQQYLSDHQDRRIELSVHEAEGRLDLVVGNRVSDQGRPSAVTKKNPENHGIGLKIVRDYIALYDGKIESTYDEEAHFLKIAVRLNEQED